MISWNFTNRRVKPIGLDIGYHSVKMVQLNAVKDGLQVTAADTVNIDPDINGDEKQRKKFIVSAIRQMLAKGDFHGRDVITALPNDKLIITNLRLSSEHNSEVHQFLRDEAAKRFGYDSEDDVINYMLAGNVQSGGEVKNEWILFAADDNTIRNHINILERAQLKPVSIDAVPCALFRSYKRLLRRQQDKEQTEFFVDIGSGSTTVVFGQGGKICFVKQLPIGGNKFNKQIAEKLSINIKEAESLRETLKKEKLVNFKADSRLPEPGSNLKSSIDASARQIIVDSISAVSEELAKEIAMCLRYYVVTFRGKSVESVVLSGGEAYESILHNVLKRQLQIEINVAQPFEGFDVANVDLDCSEHGHLCEWAIAVGLALKV